MPFWKCLKVFERMNIGGGGGNDCWWKGGWLPSDPGWHSHLTNDEQQPHRSPHDPPHSQWVPPLHPLWVPPQLQITAARAASNLHTTPAVQKRCPREFIVLAKYVPGELMMVKARQSV